MSAVEFVCLSQVPSMRVCALLISRETSSAHGLCSHVLGDSLEGGKEERSAEV